MPSAQLDQFIDALEAKAVPPLLVAILGAALLGLLFKWLEHGIICLIRSARTMRTFRAAGTAATTVQPSASDVNCPICNSLMIKRRARRGSRAGQNFMGCSN